MLTRDEIYSAVLDSIESYASGVALLWENYDSAIENSENCSIAHLIAVAACDKIMAELELERDLRNGGF